MQRDGIVRPRKSEHRKVGNERKVRRKLQVVAHIRIAREDHLLRACLRVGDHKLAVRAN
jgi:hypothetical protein